MSQLLVCFFSCVVFQRKEKKTKKKLFCWMLWNQILWRFKGGNQMKFSARQFLNISTMLRIVGQRMKTGRVVNQPLCNDVAGDSY